MLLPLMLAAATCGATGGQAALNECATARYRAADAALNAQYRHTLGVVTKEGGAQTLVAAERAWIAYRDNQCEAENALFKGGSMHGMAVTDCRVRIMRARTRELAQMEKAD